MTQDRYQAFSSPSYQGLFSLSSWAPCVHACSQRDRLLSYHLGTADNLTSCCEEGLRGSCVYSFNKHAPRLCHVPGTPKHSECCRLWGASGDVGALLASPPRHSGGRHSPVINVNSWLFRSYCNLTMTGILDHEFSSVKENTLAFSST